MPWDHKLKAVGLEAAEQLEKDLTQQDKKGSEALSAAVRKIAEMYPTQDIYITTYGYFDEDGGLCTLNVTVGNPRGGLVKPIYKGVAEDVDIVSKSERDE